MMMNIISGSATLEILVEGVTDAYSLFEGLRNQSSRMLTEETLVFGLQYLKDVMGRQLLRRLWWTHTEDMLADALTKGIIARMAIVDACTLGRWILKK
eukprot:8859917-Heterocapsa_arctica.AAC.1